MLYERFEKIMTQTSRPSRAIVHSDWIVYMALPSPIMQITFRFGHATAAPTATGPPKPIDPPMLFSQSCGGAPALWGKKPRPVVTDSSTTIAPSGIVAPSACPRPSSVNLPLGRSGRLGSTTPAGFSFSAPNSAASASSAAMGSPFTGESVVVAQPSGVSTLGLPG